MGEMGGPPAYSPPTDPRRVEEFEAKMARLTDEEREKRERAKKRVITPEEEQVRRHPWEISTSRSSSRPPRSISEEEKTFALEPEEIVDPSTAAPALSQAPVIVGRVQVPETVLPQEQEIKIPAPTAKKPGDLGLDLGLRSPRRGRSPDLNMRSPVQSPEPQALRPEQIPEQGEVREQWVRD